MLIKVINPNTTASMTEKIGASARLVAAVGTTIDAVNPSMGPASIESHYDEALAVPGVLDEIARSCPFRILQHRARTPMPRARRPAAPTALAGQSAATMESSRVG